MHYARHGVFIGDVRFVRRELDEERDPAEDPFRAHRDRRIRAWAKRRAWRARLASPTAVFFTGIASLQGIAFAMQAADFPDEDLWKIGGQLWWVVNVVGVISFLLTAVLASVLVSTISRKNKDLALQQHCRSIARYAARQGSLPLDHIGVHVWSLETPRLWGVPRWFTRHFEGRRPSWPFRWVVPVVVLKRRAAYVPERRLHPPLVFAEGKGVVGLCMRLQREVVFDLSPFSKATTSEAFYDAFSYDERLGLSWAHWQNTRQFHCIWATPLYGAIPGMRDGEAPGARELIGCLSLDVQKPGYVKRVHRMTAQRDSELESLLWDCAAGLD